MINIRMIYDEKYLKNISRIISSTILTMCNFLMPILRLNTLWSASMVTWNLDFKVVECPELQMRSCLNASLRLRHSFTEQQIVLLHTYTHNWPLQSFS